MTRSYIVGKIIIPCLLILIMLWVSIIGFVINPFIGNIILVKKNSQSFSTSYDIYTDKDYKITYLSFKSIPYRSNETPIIYINQKDGEYVLIKDWLVKAQLPDSITINQFK